MEYDLADTATDPYAGESGVWAEADLHGLTVLDAAGGWCARHDRSFSRPIMKRRDRKLTVLAPVTLDSPAVCRQLQNKGEITLKRLAIAMAAAVTSLTSMPAMAAVQAQFVEFYVTATGLHQSFFQVAPGQQPQGASCDPDFGFGFVQCFTLRQESQTYHFAQNFYFDNGVASYDYGNYRTIGETSFTLTKLTNGYRLDNFSFGYDTIRSNGLYRLNGEFVSLSAPSQVVGVPEPATWALLFLGMGAIGWSLRRKPVVRIHLA